MRLPVIATLTPYLADRFHDIGSYFAQHGYIVAIIDCRGRADSGGEFDPWMADATDYFDALEWLESRPYADGQTATWGGSYAGKNQWAVAGLRSSSLRAIAPAAAWPARRIVRRCRRARFRQCASGPAAARQTS